MSTFPTLYLDESAGQVAIFHGRDTAYHLHTLYFIRRDTTHIHAGIGEITAGGLCLPCSAEILHIGICRNRGSIHDEACSQ